MTTGDFITAVCCKGDASIADIPNPSQVARWPSEVLTLGVPTVRNYGGVTGNVSYGRIRNLLHDHKSENRKLPTYSCTRLCSTRPDQGA
jgi:hypothetical protein